MTYAETQMWKSDEIQKQWQKIFTIWHKVGFYMELTHHWYLITIQLTNTYQHHRPPSVGMPRHAFRRRMPNPLPDAPTPALGGRGVFPSRFCRAGRDPFSGPGHYFFTLKKTIPRKAISKPTRRIPLNFCIHLRITVLRKSQQGRFQF